MKLKQILLWVVPNLYTYFLLIYFLFFAPGGTIWSKLLYPMWQELFSGEVNFFLLLLVIIICAVGIVIFSTIWCALSYFGYFIVGGASIGGAIAVGMLVDNALTVAFSSIGFIMLGIAWIAAWRFPYGEFVKGDPNYTAIPVRYHYELEAKDSKTVEMKKVAEYDSDDQPPAPWFENPMLLYGRIFIILFGGLIFYIRYNRKNKT